MVEVPAAVMIAEALATEVDLFSIGTNDLTQYTLAMDLGHPMLAKQADAPHSAVLRMIDQTARAAGKAGIPVGVCGGIGGVFVLAIPNAVSHLLLYILAVLVGTVVTTVMLMALKRPLPDEATAAKTA